MAFKTLSGLWLSEKGYLSGKSNEDVVIPANTKFFIFENSKRDSDRHPTHRLAIASDEQEPQQARPANQTESPWESF